MKRNRLQFSILTMLIVASICAAWCGRRTYQANKAWVLERRAQALEGVLVYKHQIAGDHYEKDASPPIPTALKGVIDEKWFVKPTLLYLQGMHIKDADLSFLADVSDLPGIDLSCTPISDRALDFVACDAGLMSLMIYNTDITDQGIERLKGLRQLETLDIRNTKITDKGLNSLRAMTSLTYLDLTGSQVTEEAVEDFRAARPDCKVEFIPF